MVRLHQIRSDLFLCLSRCTRSAKEITMWLKTVGLVVTLALVILTTPLAADAQPRTKVPRIGLLWPGELGPSATAFRQGLRDLGYVEGQNMAIEYRYAE